MKTPCRTSPRHVDDHGFTLIEMIVVTAVISIVLVIAIPRLERGLFSNSGDETARWIIANAQNLKEKAVTDQKTYLLNVSPDTRQLWISDTEMSETDLATAREDGYRLPRGMTVEQVAFSSENIATGGTIPIAFYPKGYSDKAVIQLRTADGDRLAFVIEPFLTRVNLIRGNRGR
jgi:general secretion pathway protein H